MQSKFGKNAGVKKTLKNKTLKTEKIIYFKKI